MDWEDIGMKNTTFDTETKKEFVEQKFSESSRIKNQEGETLLHIATIQGNFERIKFLIEEGADVILSLNKLIVFIHLYRFINAIFLGERTRPAH